MNCNDTRKITVVRMDDPDVDQHGVLFRVIEVDYAGSEESKLPRKLTVSGELYNVDRIDVGACYEMICDENGQIKYFIEESAYQQRAEFIDIYFPMIRKAIITLCSAFQFCKEAGDYKVWMDAIDNLFFLLIIIGRDSDLPDDGDFFSNYLPF